jgi:predicted dehydrogenase
MPGVEHTGNSGVTALVTGDTAKAKALSRKYGIPHLYDYDGYEEMLRLNRMN